MPKSIQTAMEEVDGQGQVEPLIVTPTRKEAHTRVCKTKPRKSINLSFCNVEMEGIGLCLGRRKMNRGAIMAARGRLI